MTTSEVLRAAAKRVRQGWCQRSYRDEDDNVCALGALSDAGGYTKFHHEDAQWFEMVAAIQAALDIGLIMLWNDAPDQTQEGVALGLERAADYWESQQTPAIVWTMREDVIA